MPCGAAPQPGTAPCSSPGEPGSPGWMGPGESGGPPRPLPTPSHRPSHRPALQRRLVLGGLRGLPQQLVVSGTTARGEPQQLGETEAQRGQQHGWGWGCGPVSPRPGCAARGHGSPTRTVLPPDSGCSHSGSREPPAKPSTSSPPTPGLPDPLTLSSVTGTVCTGMGLQAASGRPGPASGNSPARLA